jgi:hypothetical protein
MRAFIVRPFGVKQGIDFDRVERDLIAPVLDELRIAGRTTGEIARAGNIRADMFELLTLADLVVADISIHNANVYYELGVRHGLRDRGTVLIRSRADDVVFDLRTDRYLEYDAADPAAARAALQKAIVDTLVQRRVDSPVYGLLPALSPPDAAVLAPVPHDFQEAVLLAQRQADLARLGLLGEETRHRTWRVSGLRLVGEAQFNLKAYRAAAATWERIRRDDPDDPQANGRLATIQQRLGNPPASDAAIERVLASRTALAAERAEMLALAGSNWKARWCEEWSALPPADRARRALASPALVEAMTSYLAAFHEDLNAYYPGINACALCRARSELAALDAATWGDGFETPAEAAHELEELRAKCNELAGAVRHAIEAARERHDSRGTDDVWLDFAAADLALLTSSRVGYIARQYAQAVERARAQRASFSVDSAVRQVRMFLALGLLTDRAQAALEALGAPATEPAPVAPPPARVIVFTGHRVDGPDRPSPRFPNTPECERLARDAVERELRAEMDAAKATGASLLAVAGGANGGDIIFHEACADLGVDTMLLLALPPAEFAARSVQSGGPGWMERFRRLCDRTTPRILAMSEELPGWLVDVDGYSLWSRNNLWTLHTALAVDRAEVTLVALWNGEAGDGPGGTEDMLELAAERGVRVVRIDTNTLFASQLAPGARAGAGADLAGP